MRNKIGFRSGARHFRQRSDNNGYMFIGKLSEQKPYNKTTYRNACQGRGDKLCTRIGGSDRGNESVQNGTQEGRL